MDLREQDAMVFLGALDAHPAAWHRKWNWRKERETEAHLKEGGSHALEDVVANIDGAGYWFGMCVSFKTGVEGLHC